MGYEQWSWVAPGAWDPLAFFFPSFVCLPFQSNASLLSRFSHCSLSCPLTCYFLLWVFVLHVCDMNTHTILFFVFCMNTKKEEKKKHSCVRCVVYTHTYSPCMFFNCPSLIHPQSLYVLLSHALPQLPSSPCCHAFLIQLFFHFSFFIFHF
ncbi:hypothetical protein BKA57DRAFT_39264 [Linnemannia elongata]|nr:hypothetical protein BKA57DRAFT_39264 [Linnemannia elongata]